MSDISRLTRNADRGSEDRRLLDELLDEVIVATVSTVVDGEPWSVPTLFARDGDRILIHGSTGAGQMRHLATGAPATVTVHTLDAIVVAQTAFDSSANYRSAVLRGSFAPVPDGERDRALRTLTDKVIHGRTTEVPPSTTRELAATAVLALPITAGKWIYKARTGPSGRPESVVDDVWVGIVPMRTVAGEPMRDSWVEQDVPVPASVHDLIEQHR